MAKNERMRNCPPRPPAGGSLLRGLPVQSPITHAVASHASCACGGLPRRGGRGGRRPRPPPGPPAPPPPLSPGRVAHADTLDDQVRAMAKQLRCPVCTAGDGSRIPMRRYSVRMRRHAERGAERDRSRRTSSRFGEGILLTPETNGSTLGVWVMPVTALSHQAAIVLGVLPRSWSPPAPGARSRSESAAGGAAPEADDERLEQELARFRRKRVRRGGGGRRTNADRPAARLGRQ